MKLLNGGPARQEIHNFSWLLSSFLVTIWLLSCSASEEFLDIESPDFTFDQDFSGIDANLGIALENRAMSYFLKGDGYLVYKILNREEMERFPWLFNKPLVGTPLSEITDSDALGYGELDQEGEGLFWTGLAIASFSCKNSELLFENVLAATNTFDGNFYRFSPLPAKYKSDPTSRDIAIAILFGLISYRKRCGDQRVEGLILNNLKAIRRNGQKLAPAGMEDKILVTPTFRVYLNLISWSLFGSNKPSDTEISMLELNFIANATQIKQTQAPCYPIHLSTLQLITLYALDVKPSKFSYESYCLITSGNGLMLTDILCNRDTGARRWLQSYVLNGTGYSHHRCSWENNTSDNLLSPAIDWLTLNPNKPYQDQ